MKCSLGDEWLVVVREAAEKICAGRLQQKRYPSGKSQKIRCQEDQGIGFSFAPISTRKVIVATTQDDVESRGSTALEGRLRRGQRPISSAA